MNTFIIIITATFAVSLGAFIGIFTLAIKEKILNKVLLLIVSLSAGVLMGDVFIHLLPEASEKFGNGDVYMFVLLSFIIFFLVEKILHWRHCHNGECKVHTFGYMSLFGDSVHNFLDGLIIAGTFLADVKLGIITTIAVALHEIPQEISDFGVLIYSGFKKRTAIIANFAVALTVVLGGIVGYLISFNTDKLTPYFLALASGGFIYIAASDLLPEIRKETNLKKSVISFGLFLIGIILMYLIKFIET